MNSRISMFITLCAIITTFIVKAPVGLVDYAILYLCLLTTFNVMDIKLIITRGSSDV